MNGIYHSAEELIGRTPLLELCGLERELGLKAKLLAKLEFMNPGGSVKDRVALNLIEDAEKRGALKKGATIIEPTSGNTGIGLAMVARLRGYKAIIVMPETMSVERQKMIKAYGAKVVLTPGRLGMSGAIEEAERLAAETEGSFIPSQFENPANPEAHERTTGPEIWADTEGKVDVFVAAVGTGGTLTGTGRYLKKMDPAVAVVAVEPASSAVLSAGIAGPHKIQGIGPGFVPKVLDISLYDGVIAVSDEDAFDMARKIAEYDGVFVGISSGAAAFAAAQLAARPENAGKNIVVILPDGGGRYLSTELVKE